MNGGVHHHLISELFQQNHSHLKTMNSEPLLMISVLFAFSRFIFCKERGSVAITKRFSSSHLYYIVSQFSFNLLSLLSKGAYNISETKTSR